MRQNNYDIQMRTAAHAFCAFDTAALAQSFGLEFDDDAIYLNILSSPYRICRKSGAVISQADGSDAGFGLTMTVYDMLTNPYGKPILSKRWCSHNHFNAVRGGTLSGNLELATDMPFLACKCEKLKAVCRTFGGIETASGDYSAILPLFDFFPVFLRFYDTDEEFPPQIQLLWDANTTRYLRYETTFYAANVILSKIKNGTLK